MEALITTQIDSEQTYQRIAKAITFLRQNYHQQPDLKTIAQQVHLSESYFQRLFTTWAGISPKRFVQYLTVEYAKSKIAETQSLLDLTLEAGLSSPGRLHDLFVNLEAMSPGEFKAKGTGLTIHYGIHLTPFGYCLIATTTRGICHLRFLENPNHNRAKQDLQAEWKNATLILDQPTTQELCDRIFNPMKTSHLPLTVHVKGTNFQIQVWRALLKIPFASITTYQQLATTIDRPTAARAVGQAVGYNPVAYLIPCHRVIRASGELGGYRWGVERKTVLLGWEASTAAHSSFLR